LAALLNLFGGLHGRGRALGVERRVV
jgi:hypothetical protein